MNKSRQLDLFLLSLFVLLITWQPFYLYRELNLFELGIYAPGIQSILDGAVPYRDFFYLRGPVELYLPAWAMMLLGKNLSVLNLYFYAGTVAALLICVWIARELFQNRIFLYSAVLVVVARTFPRVVFTYWGGFRFAIGLLAVLWVIYYFKSAKKKFLFLSSCAAAVAFLTSSEVGVIAYLSIMTAVVISAINERKKLSLFGQECVLIGAGGLLVIAPYVLYLFSQNAFGPFVDCLVTVTANMTKTFPQFSPTPNSFTDYLSAMVDPTNKNFRQITPTYFYLFFGGYLLALRKQRRMDAVELGILALFVYGVGMYASAFRNIWASQFEMALQPEKLLYFLFLERIWFSLKSEKSFLRGFKFSRELAILFLSVVTVFSIGYSFDRYHKRFFSMKYLVQAVLGKDLKQVKPFYREASERLSVTPVEGLVVPQWQAKEINELKEFFDRNTTRDEKVFAFPELAVYHFILERPFVGRFPMTTFSWMKGSWHEELLQDLITEQPRYIIMSKELTPNFEQIYFKVEKNQQMFDEVKAFLDGHYRVAFSTKNLNVLQIRGH